MVIRLHHDSPKGVQRDIGVAFHVPYGFYFALGRLDGGFDLRPSQWSKPHVTKTIGVWHTHIGPFDVMWIKR